MSGNFDNIETTTRKLAYIQERMSLVSNYMYKQFVEYQQSNVNTSLLLDKIAENMSLIVEYLKQSFSIKNIPTQNIYCEYDKQKHIAIANILWNTITFASNMKDNPKALDRTAKNFPPLITGRIIAFKGTLPELMSNGFNKETEQKILNLEVASLFVPADKTTKAIIKIKNFGNEEFYIPQSEAPREFLLKVIEIICRDGNYHNESSKITISI